jgi:hypothetical protein
MKTNAFILLVFSAILVLSSCDKNDPVDAVTYTLTVHNKSSVNADVYMKSDVANATFVKEGTVTKGGSLKITQLVMDVNYVIRAVEAGKDQNMYFTERTVKNTQTDKFDMSIDITDAN